MPETMKNPDQPKSRGSYRNPFDGKNEADNGGPGSVKQALRDVHARPGTKHQRDGSEVVKGGSGSPNEMPG